MAGLVRKATILTVGGLLLAGAAMAGAPDESNSTRPVHVNLVGYTNPPDSLAGTISYTIMDATPSPVDGASVALDFTDCTDVILDQGPAAAGITVDCVTKQVSGQTNPSGQISFKGIVADGNVTGARRVTRYCVKVRVNGVLWPNSSLSAATTDRDGINPGAGAGDLSLIILDFIEAQTASWRSDLDDDGNTGATDVSLLIAIFIATSSALSGTPCS